MRLRAYSRASVLSGDIYHKGADCFAPGRFRNPPMFSLESTLLEQRKGSDICNTVRKTYMTGFGKMS